MLTDVITKSGELRIIPVKNEDKIDGNTIMDFITILAKVKENWWVRENYSGSGNEIVATFEICFKNITIDSLNDMDIEDQVFEHFKFLNDYVAKHYSDKDIRSHVESTTLFNVEDDSIHVVFEVEMDHCSDNNVDTLLIENMCAVVASIAISSDPSSIPAARPYTRYDEYKLHPNFEYVALGSAYCTCIDVLKHAGKLEED